MCRSGENPRILLGQKCANCFRNKISRSLTIIAFAYFGSLQYRPTRFDRPEFGRVGQALMGIRTADCIIRIFKLVSIFQILN
jgi:hypothetical protein